MLQGVQEELEDLTPKPAGKRSTRTWVVRTWVGTRVEGWWWWGGSNLGCRGNRDLVAGTWVVGTWVARTWVE